MEITATTASQTKNATREISVFLELAQAFAGQKDLFTLLTLIKNESTRLVNADRGSIFLVDKEAQELWTLLADGVNVIRFPYGKGIVGSCIENNIIMNISDPDHDIRFYKEVDKQTGYKTKNILCVPMRNRYGQAVGAIEVLNKSEGAFTQYDESLLMILGTQAAVAIENVEMLEDVQESLKQLNLLTRIQQEANLLVDIQNIVEMVLREVISSVKASFGFILRLDAQENMICSCLIPPDRFATFYKGDKNFFEWTSQCPDLANVFDTASKRIEQLKKKEMFVIPSGVVAGMKDQNQLVGFIELRGIQTEDRLFNHRIMDFLKVITGQLLSFYENRRLIEEKSRTEKMAVVGNMVSIIVHDIKNPLSGISGYAQLIQRRSADEKIKGYVDIMLEELARLEDMNNELLTFVRGDNISLELQNVPVKGFIEELAELVGPNLENNAIKLKVCQDRSLEDAFFQIDKNKMKRVFINIVNNSRDAMPEGGSFTITGRILEETKEAEIQLTDTGTGMSPEVKARLFEPFFTKGKKNGTGLGMAITKNILEKHRGKVRVESELNVGTTFYIHIPILKKE